jgi:hypothetical protein
LQPPESEVEKFNLKEEKVDKIRVFPFGPKLMVLDFRGTLKKRIRPPFCSGIARPIQLHWIYDIEKF